MNNKAGTGSVLPRHVVVKGAGPRAVGAFLPKLTQKAFEKFGFSAATIITEWAGIVGGELAGYTCPERLKWPKRGEDGTAEPENRSRTRSGATLILRVDGPRSIEVQLRSRQIIERINAYFGYPAVTELRILQAPVAVVPAPHGGRISRPAEVNRHAPEVPQPPMVVAIGDVELRNALAQLGKAVRAEVRP